MSGLSKVRAAIRLTVLALVGAIMLALAGPATATPVRAVSSAPRALPPYVAAAAVDGDRLYVTSATDGNNQPKLVAQDVATGRVIAELGLPTGMSAAPMQLSADTRNHRVFVGDGGYVHVYAGIPMLHETSLEMGGAFVTALAVDAQAKRLFVGVVNPGITTSREVRVFDTDSLARVGTIAGDSDRATNLAVSIPGGHLLIGDEGRIRVVNSRNLRQVRAFRNDEVKSDSFFAFSGPRIWMANKRSPELVEFNSQGTVTGRAAVGYAAAMAWDKPHRRLVVAHRIADGNPGAKDWGYTISTVNHQGLVQEATGEVALYDYQYPQRHNLVTANGKVLYTALQAAEGREYSI